MNNKHTLRILRNKYSIARIFAELKMWGLTGQEHQELVRQRAVVGVTEIRLFRGCNKNRGSLNDRWQI